MYNAVGCTQSRSARWLVRSVVPTLVDVMSKKAACLHQGCCANLIQYIKSRVWYQEYTTVYSTSVGCLLCSSWLIASMFRRDPFAACMALVKQQFHSHHQEIRETYMFYLFATYIHKLLLICKGFCKETCKTYSVYSPGMQHKANKKSKNMFVMG